MKKVEDIIRDADIGHVHSQTIRRRRSNRFIQEMHQTVIAKMQLETDLRKAVERHEFEVFINRFIPSPTITLQALRRWSGGIIQ